MNNLDRKVVRERLLLLIEMEGIHMGVADKFDLFKYLKDHDYQKVNDVWKGSVMFLEQRGYDSLELRKTIKKTKEVEIYWSDLAEKYWMESVN